MSKGKVSCDCTFAKQHTTGVYMYSLTGISMYTVIDIKIKRLLKKKSLNVFIFIDEGQWSSWFRPLFLRHIPHSLHGKEILETNI